MFVCCHLAGQRVFQKRAAVRGISQLTVFLLLSSLCERTSSFSPRSMSQVLLPSPYARTFSVVGGSSRDELESMTVPELKEQLRSLGRKIGGRKSELVDRLVTAGDDIAIPSLSSSMPTSTHDEVVELAAAAYARVPDDAVVILACKS